jgi:8-oxo-dGTP pyrophosphatase MutT (NUDIX family)
MQRGDHQPAPSIKLSQGPPLAPPAGGKRPKYCCCILLDSRGRLVLESRPMSDRHAPGQLTCFGGTMEPHEEPLACLHRELREELGWSPAEVRYALTLHTPRGDAWFFIAQGPEEGTARALEAGVEIVYVQVQELASLKLSSWHEAALGAWQRSEAEAWVRGS